MQIRTVLLSIQALLSAPNPDDPLANDVAEHWKTNEAEAVATGMMIFNGSKEMDQRLCPSQMNSFIIIYHFDVNFLLDWEK